LDLRIHGAGKGSGGSFLGETNGADFHPGRVGVDAVGVSGPEGF
jgi:hypothetical protein